MHCVGYNTECKEKHGVCAIIAVLICRHDAVLLSNFAAKLLGRIAIILERNFYLQVS